METQQKHRVALLATLSLGLLVSSCQKDSNTVNTPNSGNDPELITTCQLVLTDSANAANVVRAVYRDPDGDGGNPPTRIDSLILDRNKTYFGQVILLNESKTPVDTISNEVYKERNDHLFFYFPTGLNASVLLTDLDNHTPPLPIGLQTSIHARGASKGTLRVVLRHQPGVKNGTYNVGETDLDVTFGARVR